MLSQRYQSKETGGNTIDIVLVNAGPTELPGNYRVSVTFDYRGCEKSVECITKNVNEVQELNRIEDKLDREFNLFKLVADKLEDEISEICDQIDEDIS